MREPARVHLDILETRTKAAGLNVLLMESVLPLARVKEANVLTLVRVPVGQMHCVL